MSDETPAFVDTNVIVYSLDRSDPVKRRIAAELLDTLATTGRLRTSTQVLQEFLVTVTRKIATPLCVDDALAILADLKTWPVFLVDVPAIERAARLTDETSISLWDALIVVAASRCGADRLYTEDLNHGQIILGVEICNPFTTNA
jgi:predicted nucleic acid-binding protein